ncbi:MAG: DUF3991 domain-containing protein [Roseburia sp.]
MRYTEEQLRQAKEVSLTQLADAYGYTPLRVGNLFTLKEHDSIRIYNDRTWCRWSRKDSKREGGGSQIDFLLQFCGIDSVAEAIKVLLEFQGIAIEDAQWKEKPLVHQAMQIKEREKLPFILPAPAEGNYRHAYAYLIKTRGLSQKVVDYFVRDLKILYEEKEHHNLVFLGKDKEGNVRYATKRGTADVYGRKYRGDVAGNDKNYGINIVNPRNDELKVFEANIDLMSYLDLTDDYASNKLVLGGTADNPLQRFLEEHSHIKSIGFCLDNDKAGMEAMYGKKEDREAAHNRPGLLEKYAGLGYQTYVDIVDPDTGCKDWNEYLIYSKKQSPEREQLPEYTRGLRNPCR